MIKNDIVHFEVRVVAEALSEYRIYFQFILDFKLPPLHFILILNYLPYILY